MLRRAVELGVDHIDTAQYYGPDVSNELIHAALHPYPEGLVIVSKVGARRDEQGGWLPAGSPAELRAGVEDNLRSLEVDQVDVVNLRVLGAAEPDQQFDDQVGAMVELRAEGLIGGIGVSNVSLAQLQRATELTEIACVQNPFNVVDRTSADVLARCESGGHRVRAVLPDGFRVRWRQPRARSAGSDRDREPAGCDTRAGRARVAARAVAEHPADPRARPRSRTSRRTWRPVISSSMTPPSTPSPSADCHTRAGVLVQ